MPDFAPTDETFLTTAARRRVAVMEIARPAAAVWTDLTRDDTLTWNRAITGLKWISPRPFGVGTTREIQVLALLKITERYVVWEEGRRKAFVGERLNLPVLKHLAEDYVVEPVSDTSCRFTWTVAWEPTTAGRPGDPLNKAVFSSLFSDTRKYFGAR
jgi:polyketide cyclase/dehydrase/lipid transport protein